jgi:hypothetical protein
MHGSGLIVRRGVGTLAGYLRTIVQGSLGQRLGGVGFECFIRNFRRESIRKIVEPSIEDRKTGKLFGIMK